MAGRSQATDRRLPGIVVGLGHRSIQESCLSARMELLWVGNQLLGGRTGDVRTLYRWSIAAG